MKITFWIILCILHPLTKPTPTSSLNIVNQYLVSSQQIRNVELFFVMSHLLESSDTSDSLKSLSKSVTVLSWSKIQIVINRARNTLLEERRLIVFVMLEDQIEIGSVLDEVS